MSKTSKILQKYVRLLTYTDACRVIDFINQNDKKDYANICAGGVSMQIQEKNYNKIKSFIESLEVRFHITDTHPYKVEQEIVSNLKNRRVIE